MSLNHILLKLSMYLNVEGSISTSMVIEDYFYINLNQGRQPYSILLTIIKEIIILLYKGPPLFLKKNYNANFNDLKDPFLVYI